MDEKSLTDEKSLKEEGSGGSPSGDTPTANVRPKVRTVLPEDVLRQFDAHVHRIRPDVMLPIALLVRGTGWRLSEILDLRIETCLERDGYGWWVRSNRSGRRRVPIPEEAAQAMEAQKVRASAGRVGAANQARHVFVGQGSGFGGNQGVGSRIIKDQVRVALLRLAQECAIMDVNGQVYPLTAGALRRAKYVEMVSVGMDLLSIQHWMGDESIYVALDYVHDTILRVT